MSIEKCTGGEWEVWQGNVYADRRALTVALCGESDVIPEDEKAANAHMLAASKKLYEALDAFSAGDIDVSGTALIYDADVRSLLDLARAALASARGEQ